MIELVGWGLRVPGASTHDAFWSILQQKKCTISRIPEDRWSCLRFWHPRIGEPGKVYTLAAGVLDDLWGFDPSVFGISPREAEQIDPQQRLLLQVTWEAIENAGIAPSALAGQQVGVFVGASSLDYSTESFFDPSLATGHFMTGNTLAVIANRLSYSFDLKGPSFTVDTACSSSLVAVHEAVTALNSGEIETAIVAGVNVLASPFPFVGFAQATMLSPEGLCRAFDARGQGYVRSEGCLACVLRRSDASPWSGQKAIASIVDVGINADGKTVGLSSPSHTHQAGLLDRIYARAGVDPDDLAFVEAHGTGTRVGDPAEALSVGSALAMRRRSALPIGSVKTNIGHLEPASGLAGLAKACLALENDLLPASLHCEEPNPDIDFEKLNLQLASEAVPLARTGSPRFAGINSFGFGGTNAHVILRDPSAPAAQADAVRMREDTAGLLVLSAKSQQALADLAKAYSAAIDGATVGEFQDIQSSAWYRKNHFDSKMVVQGKEPGAVVEALKAYATGEDTQAIMAGTQAPLGGNCAFVFSGNGAQWPGMGRAAYLNNVRFSEKFDAIAAEFEALSETSLTEHLFSSALEHNLELTSIAQPLLFAIQVSLCAALGDYGLRPHFVIGHSIGEAAAAVVSGRLTLCDGVKLVYHRSRAQEAVAGAGTMAALVMPREDVPAALENADCGGIELAAVNSPKSVSLSGRSEDLARFSEFARKSKLVVRKIDVNYPFHSSMVAPVEKPFREALGALHSQDSATGFISTVTGDLVRGTDLDTHYWWRNLRETVRFADAVRCAIDQGVRGFVEIGPKPILQSFIRQTAQEQDTDVAILGSLTTRQPLDADPVLEIVARSLVNSISLDERAVFGQNPPVPVTLPTYPWQNEPFRFQKTPESNQSLVRGTEHPLLGWRPDDRSHTWITHVDTQLLPILADHEINGRVIFPGSGFIEIALAAGRVALGVEKIEIRDLDIVQAMFLSDNSLTEIQTRYHPETGTVEISSKRRLSDDDFTLNARGRIFKAIHGDPPSAEPSHGRCGKDHDAPEIYKAARSIGLNYGSTFRRASHVEKLAETTYRVHLVTRIPDHAFCLHPAELDACFHGIFAVLMDHPDLQSNAGAYVPVHFGRFQLLADGSAPAFADITVQRVSEWSVLADFVLFEASGTAVATITGSRFRAVNFEVRERPFDLAFHLRSEPMAARSGQHFDAAPDLERPQQFIRNLAGGSLRGLVTSEEGESRLLLEAAAQRLAIDVLDVLKRRHGVVREKDFPEKLRLYLNILLNWLVHLGAVAEIHPGTYEFADLQTFPEFDDLIKTVLRECPAEIAAATLLVRARCVVMQAASNSEEEYEPSSALLDQMRFAAPDASARFELLKNWLQPFVEQWPDARPLRVLDLAGSGLELARHLLETRGRGLALITVLDPDPSCAARLAHENDFPSYVEVLDASRDLETIQSRNFDLVLSSGRLHEFSDVGEILKRVLEAPRSNVVLAAIEPVRSLLAEALYSLREGSLETAIGEQFPTSNFRSVAEWRSAINIDAGFDKVVAERAVVLGHPASLIHGCLTPAADQADKLHGDESRKSAWVIICGAAKPERKQADALAAKIEARGDHVEVFTTGRNADESAVSQMLAGLRSTPPFSEAVQKTVVSMPRRTEHGEAHVDSISRQCLNAISIAGAAAANEFTLALVAPSGSGAGANTGADHAEQSALWAFARVLQNEFPDLTVRRLDVPSEQGLPEFAEDALAAIADHPGECEIICGMSGTRHVRAVPGFRDRASTSPAAVVLGFERQGSLRTLAWHGTNRRPPGADQVEIEVAATGLNFRDVMWSLGMLPEEALEDGYGGPSLGLECSGRIVRVGSNVEHLKVGDPVIAFTRDGFASHVTVPGHAVAKIDKDQDLVAAATVPVAFLTAYYALLELGDLRKDQWLLIHGGAGGVGLAALQIAKSVGARVIATAGSDEKRNLLTTLGADHVLDSRSLAFAVDVLELTDGKGVHAVLNSLAGEAMERSIELVRPFGRFLELGKRDFYEGTRIGLRPFRRNVSYFGIDVDQLLTHDLSTAIGMIRKIFDQFRAGRYTHLPFRLFKGHNAQDAFRLMQSSGHIGKILLTPPSPAEVPVSGEAAPLEFDAEGVHVVIGGLGGFGAEVARWLADHGARRIALTSRTGLVSQDHAAMMKDLAERDVEVLPVSCDVTDRQALTQVLDDLRAVAPLKGVIHAAMVLADGSISSQDADSFAKALKPKVDGAVLLDELTAKDALDHFILFSSIATLVGNPGQANYVAANGFLEGLARDRRRRGVPALAVGWGAVKDVGFLAANPDISGKLAKVLGEAMIDAREGLDVLADVMSNDQGDLEDAVVFIGRMDWETVSQALPVLKQETYVHLAKASVGSASAARVVDLAAMVEGKTETEAKQIICSLLARELGDILRLPAGEIGFKRPLADFGMDSLMGLELRMGIQKRFNLDIPLVSLSGGTCLENFAGQILKRLGAGAEDKDTFSEVDQVQDDLAVQHLGRPLSIEQKKLVGQHIDSERETGGLLQ